MPTPLILSRAVVTRAQARRARFALYVLALTGQPYPQSHPYLHSLRLRWTSSAAPGAIVANPN